MCTITDRNITDCVSLRVCGRAQADIDRVVREIDDICGEECKDKVLDSPQDQENIEKLDDLQVSIRNTGRFTFIFNRSRPKLFSSVNHTILV